MAKSQPEKSRVLIVEDHPLFSEGLSQMINRQPTTAVCGQAPDAASAMRAVAELKPDLVLVDISLDGGNGIDLIKTLKAKYEDLPILVISMYDESLYAERALRAGALGYVMKNQPPKIVKAAIAQVLGGEIFLSEKMSSSVLGKLLRGKNDDPRFSHRATERPGAGGFSNAGGRQAFAPDRRGAESDDSDDSFVPQSHQGKAAVQKLHRNGASRHAMGSRADGSISGGIPSSEGI